jgi:hypothetical protein
MAFVGHANFFFFYGSIQTAGHCVVNRVSRLVCFCFVSSFQCYNLIGEKSFGDQKGVVVGEFLTSVSISLMIGGLTFYGIFFFLGKEKKKRAFVATRMVIMMEVGVITDESHPKSRLIILSLLGVSQSEAGATCQIHRRKVGVGVLNDFELMLLALVTNRREKERRKEKTDNNIKPK